ncbi:MAG: GPO family capsid scaffolding protein [Erythrobacter sp.]|nr:GPO family capsid scaffolding protein [Erythrobacter sp.]
MKTKQFLLATAGATVDGRTIDATMLTEMADGYDPKTYGARVNIEHIRGISGQSPFRAYGDVLELSTAEVDVNFHGKTEKRLGLFGTLDVTDEAKTLNDAGQKVFPSIEIEPNFAGKGKAYLMGVALTDSPASIATERLQFNRSLPGALTVSADRPEQAFALEFADSEATRSEASDSFLSKLGTMLENTFGKATAAEPKEPAAPEGQANDVTADTLKPLFEGLGQTFAKEMGDLRTEMRGELDQFAVQIKALETSVETTPDHQHAARPKGSGKTNGFSGF